MRDKLGAGLRKALNVMAKHLYFSVREFSVMVKSPGFEITLSLFTLPLIGCVPSCNLLDVFVYLCLFSKMGILTVPILYDDLINTCQALKTVPHRTHSDVSYENC